MWDTNDSAQESASASSHSPLTDHLQDSSSSLHSNGAMPQSVGAKPAFDQKPVQYHIHYHPLNSNRLLVAFFAGGAIALALGFFAFKSHVQPPLEGVEHQGQDQALTQWLAA